MNETYGDSRHSPTHTSETFRYPPKLSGPHRDYTYKSRRSVDINAKAYWVMVCRLCPLGFANEQRSSNEVLAFKAQWL